MKLAIYCVGNTLMADDGLGPAVYSELQAYSLPNYVDVYDLACLSMDRIQDVLNYDLIITVDALDGTDAPVGTIFKYAPTEMKHRPFGSQSLHDLKLSDLFASAMLLGYECDGVCLGMQVENPAPAIVHIGLSSRVQEKLPELVDCVLAELVLRGIPVTLRSTGEQVLPGYHHKCLEDY